jgi:sugar (pentulose or hexulose) kinase
MVRTARIIEPNDGSARRYDAFYRQYRHLYAALKEVRERGLPGVVSAEVHEPRT